MVAYGVGVRRTTDKSVSARRRAAGGRLLVGPK